MDNDLQDKLNNFLRLGYSEELDDAASAAINGAVSISFLIKTFGDFALTAYEYGGYQDPSQPLPEALTKPFSVPSSRSLSGSIGNSTD